MRDTLQGSLAPSARVQHQSGANIPELSCFRLLGEITRLPAPSQTPTAKREDYTMWGAKFVVVSAFASLFIASAAQAQQPAAPPALPQSPNMTFFVTGNGPGKGADLGGIEGADRYCQTLAERHGAGGKTWHAYLSTQE